MRRFLRLPILFLARFGSAVLGYHWPSPQYDALEALLYEGRRVDGSNMASLQHPCKLRGGTQASVGAEWLRLAYHDSATYDSVSGTGGLDASIAFELDREENVGDGMHRTLSDFETFSNKYVSRADVIALGTTFAVASCGGPVLPFRGGRIDAYSAGAFGVPEPHQDFATQAALFKRQGFNETDMITLVACGHTLGGVRSQDFPAIVSQNSDPTVPNFKLFDSTRAFDNNVITQYLDGTTENPLVTVSNATLRSDLRIFSSDGNSTFTRLSSSEAFMLSCSNVLERMLNTVPSTVTLTEPINLLHAKVATSYLTIEQGKLVFKVTFRVTQTIGTTVNNTRIVKLIWCDRHGSNSNCQQYANSAFPASHSQDDPQLSPVTFRLGFYFLRYDFVVPIEPSLSISLFWFEVIDGDGTAPRPYDNNSTGYIVAQDQLLYVPALSSVDLHGRNDSLKTYDIVAAVRDNVEPSRVYLRAFDNAMENYLPPLDISVELKRNHSIPDAEGFRFYSASFDDTGTQLTVDLHAVVNENMLTEDFMQTFFIDKNMPYTPPTTVETTIISAPSPSATSSSAITLLDDLGSWLYFLFLPAFLGVVT